jgi:hypothetical protein
LIIEYAMVQEQNKVYSLSRISTHFCTNLWFFGVQNDPHTNLPLRDHSIRGEKLAWCVGVYSPYVVYLNCGMCDSELFGHVFKTHNQTQLSAFMSWPIYLIAETPKPVFLNLYVNILNRLNLFNFAHTFKTSSEVKSHLGSHLLTPVTRLYTQHTNRHPEVASSNTMGEGDGCKGKQDF